MYVLELNTQTAARTMSEVYRRLLTIQKVWNKGCMPEGLKMESL